jgi:NitT/TauT family transport system substrate-binding protein
MKRRQLIAGSVAAVTGFPLIARAAADRTVVRIANLDIGPFTPVAFVSKLAAKHDIAVEVTGFRRGLESAQAVASGAADVGVGGLEAAVSAVAAGSPSVIIAGCTAGGIGWVARKGSGITKIEDLKGKRFAVIRGLHELVMLVEFAKHGLTSSQEKGADVQVFYINAPPALGTALRNGDVDAMSAPEPFPSRAVLEGYATNLPRPYDTELGNIPRALFMRREFLDGHREVAQRFVDAYVEAMRTFRDQPKVAEDFVLNDALKGEMTPEDWRLSLQNQTWDVSLTMEMVQTYIRDLRKYGMLRKALNGPDFTDLSLLEKAKAGGNW